jgi:hypothetical protein
MDSWSEICNISEISTTGIMYRIILGVYIYIYIYCYIYRCGSVTKRRGFGLASGFIRHWELQLQQSCYTGYNYNEHFSTGSCLNPAVGTALHCTALTSHFDDSGRRLISEADWRRLRPKADGWGLILCTVFPPTTPCRQQWKHWPSYCWLPCNATIPE